MIEEIKVNKLLECIIDKKMITYELLLNCGFDESDIKWALENDFIKCENGFYILANSKTLYIYGRKLLRSKQDKRAIECFKRCLEIDSNDYSACIQLFLYSLDNENYDEVFYYFDILNQSPVKALLVDRNLYLYLLSFITEIPLQYREYVLNLKHSDFVRNYDQKEMEWNIMTSLVFEQKFPYALKKLNSIITKKENLKARDIILRSLLKKAIIAKKANENDILQKLSNKEFDEVLKVLKEKSKIHRLSYSEEKILLLIDKLYSIKKGEALDVIYKEVNNTYEAVDNNDFFLALKLNCDHNKKINVNPYTTPIYILLNYIVVELIIKCLENGDYEQASIYLYDYLNIIEKQEYLELVCNLIRIDFINGNFIEITSVLDKLAHGDFEIDEQEYFKRYITVLESNKMDIAKLYSEVLVDIESIADREPENKGEKVHKV